MDREREIAAIVAEARKQRPGTSRAVWIAAGVIGAACAIGFAIAMVVRAAPASESPAPAATGSGFVSGLGLGLAIGVLAGLAIARQLRTHSSRNSP